MAYSMRVATDLNFTKLSNEGPLIEFGNNIWRGYFGTVVDWKGASLEFFAQFVDSLVDREHGNSLRRGAGQGLDDNSEPPAFEPLHQVIDLIPGRRVVHLLDNFVAYINDVRRAIENHYRL